MLIGSQGNSGHGQVFGAAAFRMKRTRDGEHPCVCPWVNCIIPMMVQIRFSAKSTYQNLIYTLYSTTSCFFFWYLVMRLCPIPCRLKKNACLMYQIEFRPRGVDIK